MGINLFRNVFLLFFVLVSNCVICQDKEAKEIDKLIKKAETSIEQYKDIEALKYAKAACVLAEKIDDSEKKAKSYCLTAKTLFNLDLQKQSLQYVKKASEEKYTAKDYFLQALLSEVKANNYIQLNLPSQSAEELSKILRLLKNSNDPASTELKSRTYANLAFYYVDYKDNVDSVFMYFKLQAQQLKKLPEAKYFPAISEYYAYIGRAYFDRKNNDSALYYYKKSYELKKKYKDPVIFTQYILFGDYYVKEGQYQKALDLYLKAVHNMENYSIKPSYIMEIDAKISDVYEKLGDKKKQEEYENLHLKIQNQLLVERSRNTDYALNIILNDQNDDHSVSKHRSYLWISIGVLLLLVLFFFIYKFLIKNIKHKDDHIAEVTTNIEHKEKILTQKVMETKELQQKVNDAYAEVIELAKNNDPSFYFRFQEVYPGFQEKILEVFPGLRTSELILCAYMFLGFNVKDVAEYTFKSVHTIRNRKQNLRKKFAIPTEQDMGIWLRNLTEGEPEA